MKRKTKKRKLSINQIPQSLNIIIWYKKLSFGITIRSYLIRSFQNFLEEMLTHKFFRSRSWFETFLYLNIVNDIGAPLKIQQPTYKLQLLLVVPLKERQLYNTVAVGSPFESKVLTHLMLMSGQTYHNFLGSNRDKYKNMNQIT